MAKRSKTPKLPTLFSAAAQKLFDRFPVAYEEDKVVYEGLLRAFMEELQPDDCIEEALACDVAYHTWVIQRLRSTEAGLLTHESAPSPQVSLPSKGPPNSDELMAYLATPTEVLAQRPQGNEERERLLQEFIRDHPEKFEQHLQRRAEAGKQLEQLFPSLLSKPEPTPQRTSADDAHRLDAEAFKKNSREIDQISRQIALHESRRGAALRELERYQAVRRARAPRDEILDAEYTEAPPPTGHTKP
jgi:hypothetical protein